MHDEDVELTNTLKASHRIALTPDDRAL